MRSATGPLVFSVADRSCAIAFARNSPSPKASKLIAVRIASSTRDAANNRTSSVTSFSPKALAVCSHRRRTSSARPQHSGDPEPEPFGIFGWIALVPAANSNSRSMIRLDSSDAETKGVTRTASRAAIAMIARGSSRLSSFSVRNASLVVCGHLASPFLMLSGRAAAKPGHFLTSRKAGDVAKVKIIISSPVIVLISWCKLTIFTSAAFSIIASIIGRAVSIK
jgi:hypothetical protein